MRLGEIMSSPAETVALGETVGGALERMRVAGVRHLVVVDGKEIAGVLSENDLSEEPRDDRVRDHFVLTPVIATSHTSVRDAANLLRGHNLGCLPIVDGKKLIGVVTISDLLELLGRGALKPNPQGKRWTLKHRGPRRQKQLRPS